MIFKLGELFCGPGGIALGAKWSKISHNRNEYKIEHEWAIDYDKDSCETYRKNICPDKEKSVICKDIRRINFKNLNSIDALAFGFPCNDFSVVGEQKGIDGIYGPLYSYGVKALKIFQPKWFLAENVNGLKNNNDGKTFQIILEELESAGYDLIPHLYRFEEYSVPQSRHRIIIIGIRKYLGVSFKVPIIPDAKIVTCKEALQNIPHTAPNQELTKQSTQVVERLKHIKPGQNAFNSNLPTHLQLNIKKTRISQIYKRLDPDKPAYTITGSGGGGTHVYHWSEDRALTNRERARLQTFPDNYFFFGSKESVRKQIGMAVPPLGIKIIFDAVLKSFAGIEYPSREPNISIQYNFKRVASNLR